MVDPAATPKIIKALNQEMDAVNDPTACCTRNLSGRKRDLDNPPRNTWVGGPTKNQVSPEVESERTLGLYEPVRVMQCCNCASFFLEGEEAENCPECDSEEAEEFGKVVRNEEEEEEIKPRRLGRRMDDEEEEVTEEDLDLDLDESLELLENHKFSEFNRKYGRKARVRGRNFYLINEGMKSRSQRLNNSQLRAYNVCKYFGR
jgi:hypothetical protein